MGFAPLNPSYELGVSGGRHLSPGKRAKSRPSVGDTRSSYVRVDAQSLENTPVPLAGIHDPGVGLTKKIFAKSKCLLDRTRHREGTRVCADPNNARQSQRRYAELRVAPDHAFEPWTAERMLSDVPAERVDEDVDVRQDHFDRFIRLT